VSSITKQSKSEAAAVPARARPGAADCGLEWSWMEALVWNERMLAALGNGVKRDKWPMSFRFIGLFTMSQPYAGEPIPMRKPPTGEPCAGEPHARFGGRGGLIALPDPYHKGVEND
jgi:hypothetical protein